MAGSTYSTNLKIELMTTGENSGTWGDITNTNLGTALEQAIVGYGNPDYVSDANLTISITNSNAAQAARALVLNVTSVFGSLTQTRELVVPTIQKQYIVQNNTTGGQSITVKTSAGTGITVPNGRKAHLYVNGTDVIQMFDFVDINGGTIDGATVGANSASSGAFTSLTASGATTLNGAVALGDASGDAITVPGTISSNLLFTDNTYDIGASGATRPRNLYLAGAATIGGNLSVGGTLTLTGGLILNGNVTVGDSSADTLTVNATITSNLLFTDNTYDIGASGATRPRNLFLAGNATIGGNQTLTGSLTVDSTTDSSSTTTGSIQTDGGVGIAKSLYVGGNTTLGDASTDTVTVNGYMGVGGAAVAASAVYVRNTALTGTTQTGVNSNITGTSGATSSIRSFSSLPETAASAFTVSNVAGYWASNATLGAGSTITNLHGVYISDQTQGTNNYGITSLVSSGSNKWNIYASGTAANYFAGDVQLGNGATLKIDDQDSITFGTFSSGTSGVLLQGGTSTAFLVYQAGKERMALGTTEAVFNDPGNDYDFRVESDTKTHMLFVDASANTVGINNNNPLQPLDVTGNIGLQNVSGATYVSNIDYPIMFSSEATGSIGFNGHLVLQPRGSAAGKVILAAGQGAAAMKGRVQVGPTETVINEDSDDYDFRVESDNSTHMLFVDAGNNRVGLDTSTPYQRLHVSGGAIESGTASSTNGSVVMYGTYNGATNDYISVWGSQFSSGGPTMAYGLASSGSTAWNSTYDNFSGSHSVLVIDGATLRFLGDASNNNTAVGSAVTVYERMALSRTEAVFNEDSQDIDFRVESDTNTHALFVDAGNSRVGIGESNPARTLDVNGIVRVGYALNQSNPVQNTWYDIISAMDANTSYKVSLQAIKASAEEFAMYETLYVIGGLYSNTRTSYYIVGAGAGLEYRIVNNFPSANQMQVRVTTTGASALRASIIQMP